jgi:hypothetical protein
LTFFEHAIYCMSNWIFLLATTDSNCSSKFLL